MGFTLTPKEAQDLINKDLRNKDVLFPFLNGDDLNSRPDQSPSRWVINFHDWHLNAEHDDPKNLKETPYAADYPNCLAIVEEKVKPEREKNNRKVYRDYWWQYAEKRIGLQTAIAELRRVLIAAQTSKFLSISFVNKGIIYSNATIVLAFDDYHSFVILNNSFHSSWIIEYCSRMETRMRYIPSDGFETFPFPSSTTNLNDLGEKYYNYRQSIMLTRQEGLTETYNRFHNPDESAADIQQLRELQIEMDYAVAAAYDWQDLDLGHDFHETKQGLRYTLSETARREVLDRLLRLNHQRYAEEVAAELHNNSKKKSKASSSKAKIKVSPGQVNLL